MSGNYGKRQKLELKLNLSPPSTVNVNPFSSSSSSSLMSPPQQSSASSLTSPPTPSSCLSSEITEEGGQGGLRQYSSSCTTPRTTILEARHSMVLVGCPRCFMYVMFSEDDPKCPRCNTTVLLDFLKDPNNINATKKRGRKLC